VKGNERISNGGWFGKLTTSGSTLRQAQGKPFDFASLGCARDRQGKAHHEFRIANCGEKILDVGCTVGGRVRRDLRRTMTKKWLLC